MDLGMEKRESKIGAKPIPRRARNFRVIGSSFFNLDSPLSP